MLEFLAYKKFKKNKAEKEAAKAQLDGHGSSTPSSPGGAAAATTGESDKKAGKATEVDKPLLDDDDERFLERLTSPGAENEQQEDEEGPRPPLPPRVKTPDLTWDSDSESFQKLNMSGKANATMLATKEKGKAVVDRFTLLLQRNKKKDPGNMQLAVPEPEIDREKDDLTRVLDDLNLAARNNKAFALSADSNELVRKFTLVLKDLVNGVPTAVNDLTSLLDDRDGLLAKNYEKLPGSLKKLVTQLPDKLSSTLAPELLAVAAEAQGLSKDDAAAKGGIKGAAKRLLVPKNLKDLVTKPGAVVSMLKGIMNALKLRWPAFIGTNLLWSLALFLLLFVLWYCHKRGRETRIDKENKEADANVGVVDGADRIEELPDDPALPAPSGSTATPIVIEPPTPTAADGESSSSGARHRRSGSGKKKSEK